MKPPNQRPSPARPAPPSPRPNPRRSISTRPTPPSSKTFRASVLRTPRPSSKLVPFKSVDDLERVKGLGKARIDALKDLVTTAAPAAAKTGAAKTTAKTTSKNTDETTKDMPKLKAGQKVNLNTASKEELDVLPGIGPVLAERIIEARPFKTIEDVMKVKGIKEGEFGKIKDMISVK